MTKLTFVLAFLLIALTTTAQSYITTQDCNFRAGAGTKYETLGTIPNGTTVEVLENTGKWSKINFQGTEGYVSTKYLSLTNGTTTNEADVKPSSSGGTFKTILYVLGIALVLFVIRFIVTRTSEVLGVDPGDGHKYKYRCHNCGRYSTRRGHVYKCNSGEHDWFQL